jgi:hypothetical protein
MARLLSILAGGFVLVALALSAGPAGAVPGTGNGQGNGPPFDIVRGSGVIPFSTPFGNLRVSLEVDGLTKKGVAQGTYAASIRGFINIDISGSITCLRVDGTIAVLSGVVEQTNSSIAPIGSGVIAMGVDNGSPGPDGVPVDTVLALPQGRPLYDCPEAVSQGAQMTSGDFTVHDGDFKKTVGTPAP